MAEEVAFGLKSAYILARGIRHSLEALPRDLGVPPVDGDGAVAAERRPCHLESACRRDRKNTVEGVASQALMLENILDALLNG